MKIPFWFLMCWIAFTSGNRCVTCNKKGICDSVTGRCTCFNGFTGNQCQERTCPKGKAWTDYPTAVDTAHALEECSNRGVCSRQTGICTCQTGFEGLACERMTCPTCLNGKCMSMRAAAALKNDRNLHYETTYTLWDADKMFGCVCDYGFYGHNCQKRECPKGDDPMTTGQVDEVQHVSCLCNGCSGNFVLKFKGETTVNILPTATPAELETAFEALRTVYDVTVSGTAATICDADGAVTTITFSTNSGNLPAIVVIDNLTGGTSNLVVNAGGASGTYDAIGASVDGDKELINCSNHGTCDTSTGLCTCDTNFASSNGAGLTGNIPDCGFGTATACPTTSNGICDSHGACLGAPGWTCVCSIGYAGHACNLRECPSDTAWWDEATAADTAHADVVCSNRGACDDATGLCSCDTDFTGSACNTLSCTASTTCKSHGTCKTMEELAQLASSNGELSGYTYGATPNKVATWDHDKLTGCHCNAGYYAGPYSGALAEFMQYDCSSLSCIFGQDPLITDKVDEQQTITCTADGGTLKLSFRQDTTLDVSATASAATIEAAIESLSTINAITLSYSTGSSFCSLAGVVTTITFTTELGDVPLITADTTLTTASSGSVALVVAETVASTKTNEECSKRGICDRSTGKCTCNLGYYSSDGGYNAGNRGDCGFRNTLIPLTDT